MIRLPTGIEQVLQDGASLVVPSRQRARAVQLAYAASQLAAGRRVWSSPDVLTVEAFLAREIESSAASGDASVPRILSSAEEWLLWRQCAAEATREWELVNRSALADSLRRSSTLALDNDIDVRKLPLAAGTEPALLREVQLVVDERCRALNATPVGALAAHLSSHAVLGQAHFEGFLRIPPRLAALGARGRVQTQGETDEELTRPSVVIAPDDLTELEQIARWCRTQLERRSDARILVVSNASAGARERLATLIQQTVDPAGWIERASPNTLVAIEGGSPIARNPAVAHALSTLRWLSGAAADFEAISEWLRSPYWDTPDAGTRARLDVWLRERPRMQFDLVALMAEVRAAPASMASGLLARASSAMAALGHGSASPREWSQRFGDALGEFGWPGERARSSADQQTLTRFHELLDEFGQLAGAVTSLSREAAAQWLADLAAHTPFRPADDDPIVTITPMLCDPIVRYDAIWVAGLHSEVWPQPVQPDPFLPLAAQLRARIPAASAMGQLQEARALLRAWRASADELVLSAPARSEDLELLPSPLLGPWMPQWTAPRTARLSREEEVAAHSGRGEHPRQAKGISALPAPAKLPEDALWLPLRLRRGRMIEAVDDPAGLAWDTSRPLPGGTRSLELQNTCPFRAYSEMRLGTSELGAPEPGVDPQMRGLLLHAALQKFWASVVDSDGLSALVGAPLGELIEGCVEAAAERLAGGQDSRALVRERRRTVRLIHSLCELERQRKAFQVTATEWETQVELAGARVNMRIDRIDRLGAGGRAILDYKSGQRATADWYGDRPSHPQLLAYMAAVGDEVSVMATVNVTAREVRFDGIARSPELLPKVKGVVAPEESEAGDAWQVRRREWLDRIEGLAAGFVAGHAAVDPKPGACDYCHAKSVCRIAERATDEPEADSAAAEALDA